MATDKWIFIQDGKKIQDNVLIEDKQLKEHLISHGALRISLSKNLSASFVGFAFWKSSFVLFLPKCFPIPSNGYVSGCASAARLILRVLRKYSHDAFTREPDAQRLSKSLTDPNTSSFALATWLIDDFSKHGLYCRTRNKFLLSENGIIDWHRTISQRTAYISQENTLYFDCITRNKVRDDSHFVTRLHLATLKLCLRRYGGILNLDAQMLKIEGIVPLDEGDLFEFGPIYLAKELRHAYSDRSMQLIQMLIIFLKDDHPGSARTFEIYGTSYFNLVWEEICASIIGNDMEDWSKTIPNPIWHSISGDLKESSTIRPDIVKEYQLEDGAKAVLLADAKYYSLIMPPGLSDNPGIADVIKQLVYELTIREEVNKKSLLFRGNFFIFPHEHQSDLFSIVGTVNYEGIPNSGPIKVGYMDITKAMNLYTSGKRLTEKEMEIMFQKTETISKIMPTEE